MKKVLVLLSGIVFLVGIFGNFGTVDAASYGCKPNGSSRYSDKVCLYSTTTSTKYVRRSDTYYYKYGGTLSASKAYTRSVSVSVSLSIGGSAWGIAKIEATTSVSASMSESISYTASWNIPSGYYAYIRSIFKRKKVYVKVYTYDGAYRYASYRYPAYKSYTEVRYNR